MATKAQVIGWSLLFVSYVAFYLCRKNYAFWLQGMMEAHAFSTFDVGLLGSAFEASFGIGNVVGGVLVDYSDARLLLPLSLGLAALCNFALSQSSSLPLLTVINFVHGACQSLGWPALSKILLVLFPNERERGRWYSFLSVSQSTGAALTPMLVATSVAWLGWRGALLGPFAVSSATAVLVLVGLRATAPGAADAPSAVQKRPTAAATAASGPSLVDLFRNRSLLLLGCACMFVSIVRVALATWLPTYLDQAQSQGGTAALAIMAMEMGGFVGGLSSGAVSDALFQGRRAPVMALCAVGLSASLAMFFAGAPFFPAWAPGVDALAASVAMSRQQLSIAAWCGVMGLMSFPIHVLLGLAARELVPVQLSSTAGGLVKAMGQFGSVQAGYTLASVVAWGGWGVVSSALIACAGMTAVCLLPLWTATGSTTTRAKKTA